MVMAPSRELAEQIGSVAKQLAHHAKFRALVLTGSDKVLQARQLRHPVDIVIGTPHRLRQLWKRDKLFLGQVDAFVFDEADALFSRAGGFSTDVSDFVSFLISPKNPNPNPNPNPNGNPNVERENSKICIFAGASMLGEWEDHGRDSAASALRKMRAAVKGNGDGVLHVLSQGGGKQAVGWPAGIGLRFFEAERKHEKPLALVEALKSAEKGDHPRTTLVFCNSIQSCRAIEYFLAEQYQDSGLQVLSVHGEMPLKVREKMWHTFQQALGKKDVVLVGTDMVGRGLDFNRHVDHVVHFDMPNSISDFLHRSGRTARGQDAVGRVSVVVGAGPAQRKLKHRILSRLKLTTRKQDLAKSSIVPSTARGFRRRKLPRAALSRKHMRLRRLKNVPAWR